ncbi:MAG: TlyA family RNA methyltransferase [Bdellovibrionaceae bacterium]|nr:TlyA family RNA methyltransferase [Pseudobdellovibrionaceae bacterium]
MSKERTDRNLPRLDQALVSAGLAKSRTKAKELIESGLVSVKTQERSERIVEDPSFLIPEGATVRICSSELDRYVSRGGLKLEGALKQVGVDLRGLTCLDVGQSTGGFTDCLLSFGAARVVGVDVGTDQLDPKIKSDPRVICLESLNARELDKSPDFRPLIPEGGFPFAVMDVSFISQTLIHPVLKDILSPGGKLLALVKPQFELSRKDLSGKGVVKDAKMYARVEERVRQSLADNNFDVLDWFESSLMGKDGNREFFVYAAKR